MVLVIENRDLKIGVDEARGGAICWVSKGGSPVNLLNAFDCGRFIQQSYYGAEDGSDWNGQPWRWNPVQGGSWQNRPAVVHECGKIANNRIRTVVTPRNWAGQQLLEDCVMTADITLQADHIHVEHAFEYKGNRQHPVRIQELPAVFVDRRLSQLMFYDGDKPWTGGKLQVRTPGFPNVNFNMTENWAAWVDPVTLEGVGVWVPWCSTMTSYRVGADSSCQCCDCCYFAPTLRFSIQPGIKFNYHAIRHVDKMRATFNAVRGWISKNRPEWLVCPLPDAAPARPGPADAAAAELPSRLEGQPLGCVLQIPSFISVCLNSAQSLLSPLLSSSSFSSNKK